MVAGGASVRTPVTSEQAQGAAAELQSGRKVKALSEVDLLTYPSGAEWDPK